MTISECYLKKDMSGTIYLVPPKRTYKVGEEWKSFNYFYTNKEIMTDMRDEAIKALDLGGDKQETKVENDFDDVDFTFE